MTLGIFNTISFYSPIIISISILIFSIFIGYLGKGFFYLFWILVITFLRIGLLWMIPGTNPNPKYINSLCESGNFLPYDNVTYSTYILSFTFFYLTMPMYISNNINYVVLIFFITVSYTHLTLPTSDLV